MHSRSHLPALFGFSRGKNTLLSASLRQGCCPGAQATGQQQQRCSAGRCLRCLRFERRTEAASRSSGRSHFYCASPPGATGSLLLKWGRYFNRGLFERGLIVDLLDGLLNEKKKRGERRKRSERRRYLVTGLAPRQPRAAGSGAGLWGCLWQTTRTGTIALAQGAGQIFAFHVSRLMQGGGEGREWRWDAKCQPGGPSSPR